MGRLVEEAAVIQTQGAIMNTPTDISATKFRSGWIKVYEFGFVILCSAAVNLGTQAPLNLNHCMEWAECLCHLLASILIFQIYQRLTTKWNDALTSNSQTAIAVYHQDKFSIEEMSELNTKLYYAIVLFALGVLTKIFET
jgi:hypothetical protein